MVNKMKTRIKFATPSTVKVARKLNSESQELFLSPEKDFHLETEGNYRRFLQTAIPVGYQMLNKSRPKNRFSMINSLKNLAVPRQSLSIRKNPKKIRSILNIQKNKADISSFNINTDNSKLTELSKLSVPENDKKLNTFESIRKKWKQIDERLAEKSNKTINNLVANRSKEYIENLKRKEKSQKEADLKNKGWKNIWYMSLREDSNTDNLVGYLPVGNRLNEIYAIVTEKKPLRRPKRDFIPSSLPSRAVNRSSIISIDIETSNSNSFNKPVYSFSFLDNSKVKK